MKTLNLKLCCVIALAALLMTANTQAQTKTPPEKAKTEKKAATPEEQKKKEKKKEKKAEKKAKKKAKKAAKAKAAGEKPAVVKKN